MDETQWMVRSAGSLRAGREDNGAFTVLELLAVLGVVGLLALLAVPGLARTGADARTFQCCNNLRQWARAMQMYANENGDTMPHDGMGFNGSYPDVAHLPQTWLNGSRDTNQWFNVLPRFVGEQPLSNYTAKAGATAQFNATVVPFPGGIGRIYECPSASMTLGDMQGLSGQGSEGFFSYGMDIDLKRTWNPATGSGSTMPYPKMPRAIALPKPAATVFMFDMAFNPKEWPYANSFYSVNPAARWTAFAKRHSSREGGVLEFIDGHSRYFQWSYVFNQNNPPDASLGEPRNPDIIWNPQYRAANP